MGQAGAERTPFHPVFEERTGFDLVDAQDFQSEPVARIHLPVRVPFGFHGSWLPDPD